MSILKGDYIGFKYNNIHSSELGIIRVSNGSRFEENLLPNMQDKTVQIPGSDGSYYFGSYYTSRQINLSFAFDGMTEQQLKRLKTLLGDKGIHPLIFDETPYKTYYAKVTGSNTIKFIPFSEGETNRVYKGEGSIQFTCYQPYAVCEKKDLSDYDEIHAKEWNDAAGLIKLREEGVDIIVENLTDKTQSRIYTHNPGDKESDWRMFFKFSEDGTFPKTIMRSRGQNLVISRIKAKTYLIGAGANERDEIVGFDSKTGLIEGYYRYYYTENNEEKVKFNKTGNIYNEYMSGGFFKIPTVQQLAIEGKTNPNIVFINDNAEDNDILLENFIALKYNYYYY